MLVTFIALEVSESIFVRNQSNYVYPADGDSIGIPLMGIMLYEVVALILLLIGMGMVRQSGFAAETVGCTRYIVTLDCLLPSGEYGSHDIFFGYLQREQAGLWS